MRIFIYEHLTARGEGRSAESSGHAMYLEGRAMRDAVAADFASLPGSEVFVFPEAAAPVTIEQVIEEAVRAEWTLLIAPELDDTLGSLAEAVSRAGDRLLGSTPEAVRLASNKLSLFEHWRARNIPTPATTDRLPSGCEAFPQIWKPRDGAGSTLTFLLHSPMDVARARAIRSMEAPELPMVLQEYVSGQAASLAFLCGTAGHLPLLPARQLLSADGRFSYLGGEIPLSPRLSARAESIGRRAIDGVSGLRGYVGVDLVLGPDADGSRDYAIEINPRLTTSYVGLRRLALDNLAAAMLEAAVQRRPTVRWRPGQVRFEPSGAVWETFNGN